MIARIRDSRLELERTGPAGHGARNHARRRIERKSRWQRVREILIPARSPGSRQSLAIRCTDSHRPQHRRGGQIDCVNRQEEPAPLAVHTIRETKTDVICPSRRRPGKHPAGAQRHTCGQILRIGKGHRSRIVERRKRVRIGRACERRREIIVVLQRQRRDFQTESLRNGVNSVVHGKRKGIRRRAGRRRHTLKSNLRAASRRCDLRQHANIQPRRQRRPGDYAPSIIPAPSGRTQGDLRRPQLPRSQIRRSRDRKRGRRLIDHKSDAAHRDGARPRSRRVRGHVVSYGTASRARSRSRKRKPASVARRRPRATRRRHRKA